MKMILAHENYSDIDDNSTQVDYNNNDSLKNSV